MTQSELLETLISLFSRYSPSTDTSEGSLFRVQFAEPLAKLIASPDTSDVTNLIKDRLSKEFPELGVSDPGSPAADYLAKAGSLMLEPLRQEIEFYRRRRGGLANPSLLSGEAADEIAGTFFMSIKKAGFSIVTVRMYFRDTFERILNISNVARAPGGKTFIPLYVTAIHEEDLLANTDGEYYYFDAEFIAENPGSAYQVEAGEIFTVDEVPGLVAATNLEPSSSVSDGQTPTEFVEQIIKSLSERSLVTKRGISAVLNAEIDDISDIYVVGHGDKEMDRDILTATPIVEAVNKPTAHVASGDSYVGETEFSVFHLTRTVSLKNGVNYVNDGEIGDVVNINGLDRKIVLVEYSEHKKYRLDDFSNIYYGRIKVDEEYKPIGGLDCRLERVPFARRYDGQPFDPVFYGDIAYGRGSQENQFEGPYVVQAAYGSEIWMENGFAILSYGTNATVEQNSRDRVTVEGDIHFAWPDGDVRITLDDGGSFFEGKEVTGYTNNQNGTTTFFLASQMSGPVTNAHWILWKVTDYTSKVLFLPGLGMNEEVYLAIIRLNTKLTLDDLLTTGTHVSTWYMRRPVETEIDAVLSISGVPGGVLDETLVVEPDEIHLGGKADVYVFPSADYESASLDITPVRDKDPVAALGPASWMNGGDDVACKDVPAEEIDLKCASISIKNGSAIDSYRVYDADVGHVKVDTTFESTGSSERIWVHSPYVSVSLRQPYAIRASGSDLRIPVASRVVYTNVSLVDVSVGDVLKILSSDQNAGEYTIEEIGVGEITLDRAPPVSRENVKFEIYTKIAGASMPIVRVTGVSLGDGMGTEVAVPCGSPMGIIAVRDFQNVGSGVKFPNAAVPVLFGSLEYDRYWYVVTTNAISEIQPSVALGDYVNILRPDPYHGKYEITKIEKVVRDGTTLTRLQIDMDKPDRGAPTFVNIEIVGGETTGTVRAYFQDRTLFYVKNSTPFTSGELKFYCREPHVLYKTPVDSKARVVQNNGSWAIWGFDGLDRYKGLLVGKYVSVNTKAVSSGIPGGKANVSGRTLTFSFKNGRVQSVLFKGQNPVPLSASGTPGGIVEQINNTINGVTAWASGETLYIGSEELFIIVPGSANNALGLEDSASNFSENFGVYRIVDIEGTEDGYPTFLMKIEPISGVRQFTAEENVCFSVFDIGAIVFPDGMTYDDKLKLYYQDFEVHSGDFGDEYNLSRGDPLSVDFSDEILYGWHVTTRNPSLAFSVYEDIDLHVSAMFYGPTAADIKGTTYTAPTNELIVYYEHDATALSAQRIIDKEDNRVICADVLAKAARPAVVIGEVSYYGGEAEETVLPSVKQNIRGVGFGKPLDVSAVRGVVSSFGATDFDDPVELHVVYTDSNRENHMVQVLDRVALNPPYHVLPDKDRFSVRKVS